MMYTPSELRAIDRLVAERVMGWTELRATAYGAWTGYSPEENARGEKREREEVPFYSSNIKNAWEVVSLLRKQGAGVSLKDTEEGYWQCEFTIVGAVFIYTAPTVMGAICGAALQQVGGIAVNEVGI